MGEPVFEPTAPMSNWIGVAKHRFHPDLTARTDLDGTTRHVVGPQIEGAAARQREARMMPVAGQDAILDAAPFERETHMGAAIVERKDVTALLHEEDRAVTAMHDEPPFGFQFIEAAGGHEIRGRGVHGRLIRGISRQRHSARGVPRMSIRSTNAAIDLPGECQHDRLTRAGNRLRSAARF